MTNVRKHKSDSNPRESKISTPGLVGFNLSEFSFSPLSEKTTALANTSVRHEWTQNVPGEGESEFFFESSFGRVVPNAHTEDLLLVLAQLAIESEDPLSVPVSFYKLHNLRQQKHRPSKQQIAQYTRHLDALLGTLINTNHIYDRKKKRWLGVKSNVLAAYSYKDEKGRILKQITGVDDESDLGYVLVEQKIRELEEFNFSSLFFEHFISDAIPIDLAVYFTLLKTPTQRRIYRFGNKYIILYGSHEQDLKLFCKKIGMNPSYVDNTPAYRIVNKIRQHLVRVSTYGGMRVQAVKSKSTDSGYKIVFDQEPTQVGLLPFYKQASKREKEAFNALRKAGLFENPARKLLQLKIERMGDLAPDYIKFSVRKFNKMLKSGQLRAPENKAGGVLAKYLEKDWFFAEFIEWQNKKDKSARKEEKRFFGGVNDIADILSDTKTSSPEPTTSKKRRFTLKGFISSNPLLYKRLSSLTLQRYKEKKEAFESEGGFMKEDAYKAAIENALNSYCRQVFNEHLAGNTDYFPEDLLTIG